MSKYVNIFLLSFEVPLIVKKKMIGIKNVIWGNFVCIKKRTRMPRIGGGVQGGGGEGGGGHLEFRI